MAASVGRYELLRRLGRGGMAEVFLARRRGPGGVEKRLAVKRIRRERARDPRFLDLFVEEARMSMALAHKNIVPTFDFGRVGDELFLVMEYVDGADLGAALAAGTAAGKPIDAQVAAHVALEACQALDFAHRGENGDRPVIHRDVTPRNVLLSYAGEVKLVDFGVATSEVQVGSASLRGTPGYMSPEQARGEPVDARSDVFSLGLVLYESLAGRRAYPGDTAAEALADARRAHIEPLPDTVPEGLRAIVARATATNPSDRYPTARDMQIALDDQVMTARRPGSPPPSVALAEWLATVHPRTSARDAAHLAAPEGAVVTFLEDGEEGIKAGHATRVSMAETLADPDQVATSPEIPTPPTPTPTPTPTRTPSPSPSPTSIPSRRSLALALALTLVTGTVLALFWMRRGQPSEPDNIVTPPVTQPDARAVAPTVDAGITDAPPIAVVIATPDAGAKTPRKRPDAGAIVVRTKIDAGAAEPPGKVSVNSSPWAEVDVIGRGKKCSETPCTFDLPPGRYTLRLRNPVAGVGATRDVTVVSGQTERVSVALTRPLDP